MFSYIIFNPYWIDCVATAVVVYGLVVSSYMTSISCLDIMLTLGPRELMYWKLGFHKSYVFVYDLIMIHCITFLLEFHCVGT